MKSDATASSFFVKVMQQNRMDRAQGSKNASYTPGSGSEIMPGTFDFRAVYDKIASMNTQAHRITDANTLIQDRRKTAAELEERFHDSADYRNCIVNPYDHFEAPVSRVDSAGDRNGYSEDDNGPASALEANRVISRALTDLSKKLHLSIDPELQKLSITSVSKEAVQQLSEIMFALKNIAGLFDEAVANNQPIDLGNQVLSVSDSKELGAYIQSQLFKVEVGIGMLGAGEQVRDMLAQKMSLTPGGNIPQALDPTQLSMSQVHAQKIFGDMFSEPSSNLTLLSQKIRELCAANGNGQQGGVNLNIISGKSAAEGPNFLFDGATMRALLKIDGKVASENAAAAQNEKIDLLFGSVNLLKKDSAAVKGAMEQFPLVDGSAKGNFGQIIAGMEVKSQGVSYRTLDESVMRQLADKMHMAFRTGANEIRIQLRPETLGDVKIRIRVEGDVVFAKIQVENQQIKQIVENNMQFLKDSLSQQNLTAGSLDVNVGGDGFSSEGDREVYQAGQGAQGSGTSEGSETDSGSTTAAIEIGSETGRRFGDNSVEYFV